MRDRSWILAGLLAFLAFVTLPVWTRLAARPAATRPDLVLPVRQTQCVMPVSYMRTSHMKLLLEWRDGVVRNGVRTFNSHDGKTYNVSLVRTCLDCHNKTTFCDRCHDYVGVQTPYCWNCHVDPSLPLAAVNRSQK